MVSDWYGNTVICTAVCGAYEHSISLALVNGVDYIYFSDGKSNFPIIKPWKEIVLGDEHLDNRRRSKRPKLNPHSVPELTKYKYMVWIDGSMTIINPNFVSEIMEYMVNGYVASPHFDNRHCAYGEATIRPKKYANEPLDAQVEFYRSEGFPEQYGLYECGLSVRDMTNFKVRDLGKLWHAQNLNWSYQDQVSFPYCLWKINFQPDVLPKSFRDYNWVIVNAHKRED
jgi:hypothetical protein